VTFDPGPFNGFYAYMAHNHNSLGTEGQGQRTVSVFKNRGQGRNAVGDAVGVSVMLNRA